MRICGENVEDFRSDLRMFRRRKHHDRRNMIWKQKVRLVRLNFCQVTRGGRCHYGI